MLILEYTTPDGSLGNILRGIIVNSSQKNINPPCKDIITKDLLESRPVVLVHCYTLKELIESLKHLLDNGLIIKFAREIIPNDYDLGLVRNLEINKSVLDSNTNIFVKRFRYYFILSNKDESRTLCLTFNPETNLLKYINVKMPDNIVRCTTFQAAMENLKYRELEKVRTCDTDGGKYTYYQTK